MFRPYLAIFRSICYLQLTVKERKHIQYAYLWVLHICGVQRDLVVYQIKGYCIFVVFKEISLFTRLSVLCNGLKYERFTVGL